MFDKVHHKRTDQLHKKEDDLYATDDQEPSEESHCSPNKTEGGGELYPSVPLDLVEGVEVDLDKHFVEGGCSSAKTKKNVMNLTTDIFIIFDLTKLS